MPMRIATAPVSWGVMEVAGFGGTRSYGQMLDEMVEAGYAGTELGPYGFLPTDPGFLVEELSNRGLALVGAFVTLPFARPECHQEAFEEAMRVAGLLAAAEAPVIVLADAMSDARMRLAGRVTDGRDGLSDSQWKQAAALVGRVSRAARDLGLAAVFHHHAGTYVETPAELRRLCELVDSELLGVCLDTGHYHYGGGDPVAAVSEFGERIRHLHLKDIRQNVLDEARREGAGFVDAVRRGVFCPLGEGVVDLRGVIQALSAAGYQGWAVFEQDVDPSGSGAAPFESAKSSRAFLREAAGL